MKNEIFWLDVRARIYKTTYSGVGGSGMLSLFMYEVIIYDRAERLDMAHSC